MPHIPQHPNVALMAEADVLRPGLFFDHDPATDLFHGWFPNYGTDDEFIQGNAVTRAGTTDWERVTGGRFAGTVAALARIKFCTTTDFLDGNQLIFDWYGRIDGYPITGGVLFHKGVNTALAGNPWLIAAVNTGCIRGSVRLSDTTAISINSTTGITTIGQFHIIQMVYNGEAGVGNDTLALYLDGVKVANDTTFAAGQAALDNTEDNPTSFGSNNAAATIECSSIEARIRKGTV